MITPSTTFAEARLMIEAIIPNSQAETNIQDELLGYSNMQLLDAELGSPNDNWDAPLEMVYNLMDECHDGAYAPEEGQEAPFTEDDLEQFMITHNLIPITP